MRTPTILTTILTIRRPAVVREISYRLLCVVVSGKDDFIAEYGGTSEWDAAVEAKPKSVRDTDTGSQPATAAAAFFEAAAESESEEEQTLEPEPEPVALQGYQDCVLYVSQSESEEEEEELLEPEPDLEQGLRQLEEMGFGTEASLRALQAYPSVEAAAGWLLQGGADDCEDSEPAPAPASAPARQAELEEERIDPSDGLLYGKDDFMAEYGGTSEWDAAAPPPAAAAGERSGTGSQGQSAGSMEAYVSSGLAALSVDEDLCEYFVGMMAAMGILLAEEGCDSEAFDEARTNLVELLVDGYAVDDKEANDFVTGAPDVLAAKAVVQAIKTNTEAVAGRRADGRGNSRRIGAMRGDAKMKIGYSPPPPRNCLLVSSVVFQTEIRKLCF